MSQFNSHHLLSISDSLIRLLLKTHEFYSEENDDKMYIKITSKQLKTLLIQNNTIR